MRRLREIAFGFLAALPLLIDWTYRYVILQRPFWMRDYDAEATSFFQALRIALGDHPTYIDHPGTPVQLAGAAIVAVTGRDPVAIVPFLRAAYVVALVASLIAIVELRRGLLRDRDPWLWVVASWTYWMAPTALAYQTIWCAETFFFFAGVLALVAVARVNERAASVMLAGFAIGVCVAIKFVFAAWAIALIVVLARRAAATAGGILAGFVTGTAAAFPEYPRMFRWVWQLAAHRGTYGAGAVGLPDLYTVVRNAAALAWYAVFLLLWAVVLAVMLLRRRHATLLTRFALVAIAASIAFGLRAPGPDFHYFLPIPLALIALVATIDNPLPRVAVIAAAMLMSAALIRELAQYTTFVTGQKAIRAAIDAAVAAHAPGGVVIYTWRAPEPALALQSMTDEPRFRRPIGNRYPCAGHWVPWHEGVQLPPGARAWNALVLDERWLKQFPEPLGKTVAVVPPYRIIVK